jgi:hypothetical protein
MLNDKKENKKQVAPPIEERKGCACIVMDKEGPNGRCSKYLTPKSKTKPLGGRRGQRGEKNLECQLEGEPNKLDNAFDAKAYQKIGPHNRNIEHHKRPHLYPQGMMKHQKGCELLIIKIAALNHYHPLEGKTKG